MTVTKRKREGGEGGKCLGAGARPAEVKSQTPGHIRTINKGPKPRAVACYQHQPSFEASRLAVSRRGHQDKFHLSPKDQWPTKTCKVFSHWSTLRSDVILFELLGWRALPSGLHALGAVRMETAGKGTRQRWKCGRLMNLVFCRLKCKGKGAINPRMVSIILQWNTLEHFRSHWCMQYTFTDPYSHNGSECILRKLDEIEEN